MCRSQGRLTRGNNYHPPFKHLPNPTLSSSLNHWGQFLSKQDKDQDLKTTAQKSQTTTPEHRSNVSAPPSLKNHPTHQPDLHPTTRLKGPNKDNPNHQASSSPSPKRDSLSLKIRATFLVLASIRSNIHKLCKIQSFTHFLLNQGLSTNARQTLTTKQSRYLKSLYWIVS